ncbi:8-oxo-dGTP pyrophosphatase MutT (NUDIX family) [Azorhizobium sp. AG788]|uniref:NUDIX hydrolase n=1 Tax=Azorhizobium sp. AG788 TaxID=2183897 RepID=UPI0010DF572A|nr:8-oxo-dGTP pyrophosphatase MutT (NUDIX family) [Azorhizobium sp. AG788]
MPSAPKVRAQRRIQYAALPYRQRQDGEVQIRLITSRETRRWVIPKGWPMKGLSPAKAAAREAYEEAGLLGSISTEPLGMYSYDKRLTLQTVPCDVIVFPMKVKRYMKNWPERAERFGFWFSIESAAAAVQEEELRQIILAFGAMMADRFAKKRSRAPVSTEAEDASEDAEGAAADRARKALAAKTKAAKDKAAKDKAAKEKVAADAGPMSDGLGTSAKGKVTGGKATKAKATKAKPVKAKVAKAKTVSSDVVPNVQDAATPVVTPAKAKAKPAKPKAAKSAGAKPKAAKAKAAQAASMTEVPAFDGSAPSPATAKARASKAGSTKPRVAKAKAEAEAVASAAKPKAAKRKAAPKAKGGPKPKGPAAKTKSAAAKRAKGKTGVVPGTVASAAAKGKDAPAEVPAGWALKLPPSTTRH